MDRIRYEGYVVARNAIAAQPLDEFATWTLCDLAEALLLARDGTEAEEAREAVLEGLALLVARHDLTRRAAVRFWVHLKACGPPMHWPPTWEGSPVPSPA
jgi:hypothetical protein